MAVVGVFICCYMTGAGLAGGVRIAFASIMFLLAAASARAQQPFVTDDADVTSRGAVHVEVSNEYDWLQRSQFPHLQQNTFNLRVNVGVGAGLELDLDSPLITVVNDPAVLPVTPFGVGDTNFGMKCRIHEEHDGSSAPAVSAALYIEIPTGEPRTGLGSGLTDVWIYAIVQKAIRPSLTLRVNAGYLFAGNTSTGVVGIETVRGHIATMSASVARRLTDAWTLGAEVSGAATSKAGLEREQLQVLVGAMCVLRPALTLDLAVLAGHFTASPRRGVLVGLAIDLLRAPRASNN